VTDIYGNTAIVTSERTVTIKTRYICPHDVIINATSFSLPTDAPCYFFGNITIGGGDWTSTLEIPSGAKIYFTIQGATWDGESWRYNPCNFYIGNPEGPGKGVLRATGALFSTKPVGLAMIGRKSARWNGLWFTENTEESKLSDCRFENYAASPYGFATSEVQKRVTIE
jgi:hypothetical protein